QRRLAVARMAGDDPFRGIDLGDGLERVDHPLHAPRPGHQRAAVDLVAEQLVDAAGPEAILVVDGDLPEVELRDGIASASERRAVALPSSHFKPLNDPAQPTPRPHPEASMVTGDRYGGHGGGRNGWGFMKAPTWEEGSRHRWPPPHPLYSEALMRYFQPPPETRFYASVDLHARSLLRRRRVSPRACGKRCQYVCRCRGPRYMPVTLRVSARILRSVETFASGSR